MDEIRLYDSELKLMRLLWERGSASAKELALLAKERVGWNKNTTYTVVNKLVAKGIIARGEPGFICTPLVTRKQAVRSETNGLIDRFFEGSAHSFFASFVKDEGLTRDELDELYDLIRSREEA